VKKLFLVALVVAMLASFVFADIIHLKNGRKLEGKIISETHESITVQLENGTVEIFKSQISEIEKKALPRETYEKKAAEIAKDDAEGHYLLALWCREQGLGRECELELEKVIKIEPDHAAARRLLGYERKEGKWIKNEPEKTVEKPDKSEVAAIIRKFFVSDPSLYEKVLERLRKFEGMSKEDFNLCAEVIRNWRAYKPQPTGEVETDSKNSGLSSKMIVPDSYSPGKRIPVIITLHGDGETPGDMLNAWRASGALEKISRECVLVIPKSDNTRWWEPEMTRKLSLLVNELKNTFNVDTNRIYLNGFSNGAHGAWYFGLHSPDVFAAFALDSGLPINAEGNKIDFDVLFNARNLPVFIMNGREDKTAPGIRIGVVISKLKDAKCPDIVHREFEGGHRIHAVDAWKNVYDWFKKHKRSVFPNSVAIYYDGMGPLNSFWLELRNAQKGARASAQVRDGQIEIKASGARQVTVYLSDELVNLNEKVTVRLNNARVFRGMVKRCPATALASCFERNDREMVYAASLTFDLPGPKEDSKEK